MKSRTVGAAEQSLCRAVPGGTGITVVALLFTKQPDLQILQNALHKVQNYHPILRSKLHLDCRTRKFSFVTPNVSSLQVKSIDLPSTMGIVEIRDEPVPPFQMIVEHELNLNLWENIPRESDGFDMMEAKVYEMKGGNWAVIVKAHMVACDKASSNTILRELVQLLVEPGAELETGEVKMGIEEYMPSGKGKKSLWARGINMLSYSLTAFRLSNIEFVDTRSPRRTQLASLRLEPEAATRLLKECRKREIRVWGVLAAAALMAARRTKTVTQSEKYSVTTLIDCRSLLDPPLSCHVVGSYYSAIVTTHDIIGRERLWDLAERTYNSFNTAKIENKHFSDMPDLGFLMRRAIENPGLTPSSSLRTAFLSIFEDVPIYDDEPDYKAVGVVDYVATSSIHGVGPTLALFGEIRDGGLDCRCAYPSSLHSRDQILTLLHHIKTILMEVVN